MLAKITEKFNLMIGLFDTTRPICVVPFLQSCWRKIKHPGHLNYHWKAVQITRLLFLFFIFWSFMIHHVRLNPLLLSWPTDSITRVIPVSDRMLLSSAVVTVAREFIGRWAGRLRSVAATAAEALCAMPEVFCSEIKKTKRPWTCSDVSQR